MNDTNDLPDPVGNPKQVPRAKPRRKRAGYRLLTGSASNSMPLRERTVYSLVYAGHSVRAVSTLTGISHSTVTRILRELESRQLVKKVNRRWKATDAGEKLWTMTKQGTPAYLSIRASSLPLSQRTLVSLLSSIAVDFRLRRKPMSWIAKVIGVSRKTARRSVQGLLDRGVIQEANGYWEMALERKWAIAEQNQRDVLLGEIQTTFKLTPFDFDRIASLALNWPPRKLQDDANIALTKQHPTSYLISCLANHKRK